MTSLFLRRKKCKGYTLVEIVAALGAFTLIMLTVTQIFGRSLVSYRETKKTQTNLETAQSALNLMAKELRTSSIVDASAGATISSIKFFDYSQNRCIEYVFHETDAQITRREVDYVDPDPADNLVDEQWNYCSGHTFVSAPEVLLVGLSEQSLNVVTSVMPNPDPRVGRVSVVVTVGQGSNATTLQTTVSLRDFNYTGT